MNPKNCKLQGALKQYEVKQWELADAMGMGETTICRMLRKELKKDALDALIGKVIEISKARRSLHE